MVWNMNELVLKSDWSRWIGQDGQTQRGKGMQGCRMATSEGHATDHIKLTIQFTAHRYRYFTNVFLNFC